MKEGAIYLPRRWPSLAQMHQCYLCDIDVVLTYQLVAYAMFYSVSQENVLF